jgi:hypothetical protein
MLDTGITITKQVEDSRYALDGTRTSFIRVEFYVGKHGPFVDRFPKEEFSAAVRDDKLNTFAREVRT